MPSNDIDFDPRNSDLNIGLEVEYPVAETRDEILIRRGHPSNDVQSRVSHWPSSIGGRATYDGTVGLEVVSDVLDLEDASNWYRDVLDHVRNEHNARFQPTGLMEGGSTAGLHVHLSRLSRSQAQELADLSNEPWLQVLFCSSIATNRDGEVAWPVFRGGRYVNMSYGTSHYDVVNGRGDGHYEWRLPEPMVPEQIEVLVKFLRLFEQDTDAAIEYAQELLDEGDSRITSVRRAEAIGMDIDEMPTVERNQSDADPENFFETVREDWAYPEIYRVEYAGNEFYTFDSRLEGEFEANGVTFSDESVLHADSLDEITASDLQENIRTALNRRGETRRETEATEELKKVLKKKK